MKRRVLKSLLALLVFLVVLVCLIRFHGAGSKMALDRYKADLLAKGEVLSLAKLAGTPSTNEAEVASRQKLASLTPSLSLGTFDLPEYVVPGKVRLSWQGNLRLAPLPSPTNSKPNWQDLSSANASAAAILDQVRAALETPPPDTGWVWTDDFDTNSTWKGNFVHDRILAQSLQNAVIENLHRTNLPMAVSNLHALAQLARMNRNEVTLVSQMIRIAITGVELNNTWEALQAPGWDDAMLASLQKDWEGLDLLAAVERGMEGERAHGQIVMAKLRKSSTGERIKLLDNWVGTLSRSSTSSGGGILQTGWYLAAQSYLRSLIYFTVGGMNQDELFQLQEESKTLDAIGTLRKGRPWSEANSILTNIVADIESTVGVKPYRFLIAAIRLPNFQRATQNAVELETRRRMTLAAIAIKRFQLKHGTTPTGLSALVPEFLSSTPIDPMSGKELCYRLNADGTFILYSVGEDGVDNGGDPTVAKPGDKPDMWTGKDAVWPSAATPDEQAASDATAPKSRSDNP